MGKNPSIQHVKNYQLGTRTLVRRTATYTRNNAPQNAKMEGAPQYFTKNLCPQLFVAKAQSLQLFPVTVFQTHGIALPATAPSYSSKTPRL